MFRAVILVALHVTCCPMFELRLTVCEPWQTNSPFYLWSCIIFIACIPCHYYSRVACHNSSEVRTVTRTVCEPWQTNTPQHAYQSVPENIKHGVINSLFFVLCNAICSFCVLALYEFSAALSGYNDSTHRHRWLQYARTRVSQEKMILLCPLLLWRVRSILSSEFGPFLSVKIWCIYDSSSGAHNFLIYDHKNYLNVSSARSFCCLSIDTGFD